MKPVIGWSREGETWESWVTFYILKPFAFRIGHIILSLWFCEVQGMPNNLNLNLFSLYALCCIGEKCD